MEHTKNGKKRFIHPGGLKSACDRCWECKCVSLVLHRGSLSSLDQGGCVIGSEPSSAGRTLTGGGEEKNVVCDGKDEQRCGNNIYRLTYNLTCVELGIYGRETEDKRMG